MKNWMMILAEGKVEWIVLVVVLVIGAIGSLINKVRESRQAGQRREDRAARSQTDEGQRETQTRMDRLNDLAERRRQQLQELANRRREAAARGERVSERPRPTPVPPPAERRVDAEADHRRQAARRAEMERREAAQHRAEAQRQAEVQRREALRRRAEQKAQHEAGRARRAARQSATRPVEGRHLEPSVDSRRVRRSPRRVSQRMDVVGAQPGHEGEVHRHVPDAEAVTKDQAAPWVNQLKDLDRSKLRQAFVLRELLDRPIALRNPMADPMSR